MRGVVRSGLGVARLRIPSCFDFTPYPGTLNLRSLEEVRFDNGADGILVDWPGGPIPFRYGEISGHRIAAIGAAKRVYLDWSLEVFAPVHLRSALQLEDGDVIELRLAGERGL